MFVILISLIIALFVALLILNVYFRAKVLKVYGYLVQNKVEFGANHLFNEEKMRNEIISKYPQHEEQILTFASHIKYSLRLASYLIVLITLFGAVLMYFR